MPGESEILTLIAKELGAVCLAGGTGFRSSNYERTKAGMHLASGAASATSEMLKLLMVTGGEATKAATGIAGQVLSVVPVVMDQAKNALSAKSFEESLGLPKITPFNFEKFHQEQRVKTQNDLLKFYDGLSSDAMQRLIIGVPPEEVNRPPGLLGLRAIGEALRLLPQAQKEEIVSMFTAAAKRYNDASHLRQSDNSFYLANSLSPPSEKTKLQDALTRFVSQHGITQDIQKLMLEPNFPDNIQGADFEKYMGIVEPVKLHREVQKIREELIAASSNGDILTAAEREAIHQQTPIPTRGDVAMIMSCTRNREQAIQKAIKKKIFDRIQMSQIISEEARDYAQFMRDMHAPDKDTNIDKKLERIISFLHKNDGSGKLANEINKELGKALETNPALEAALNGCYRQSMQAVYDTVFPELNRGSKVAPDRGFALDFYKKHLKDPKDRAALMASFHHELSRIDNPSLAPTNPVSMMKIALLIGTLDPQNDKEAFEAYKGVMEEMRKNLQVKIANTRDPALLKTFTDSLELLDNAILISFSDRGARLESKDQKKGYAANVFTWFSRSATAVGVLAPPSMVVTAPVAATFASLTALLHLKKYTPDIERRNSLSFVRNPEEHARQYYTDTLSQLRTMLSQIKQQAAKIELQIPKVQSQAVRDAVSRAHAQIEIGIINIELAISKLQELGEFPKPEDMKSENPVEEAVRYEQAIDKIWNTVTEQYKGITEKIKPEMDIVQAENAKLAPETARKNMFHFGL